MTENERYGDKDYVEGGAKGAKKQKEWMEKIEAAIAKAKLSRGAQVVWSTLQEGGYDNVPRKEKKFLNFLSNSLNIRDFAACKEMWTIFESTFDAKVETPKKAPSKKVVELKSEGGKPWYAQLAAAAGSGTSSRTEFYMKISLETNNGKIQPK